MPAKTTEHKKRVEEKREHVATDEDQALLHDVRMLYEWHAPGRPYRKRTREFYINSLLIVVALEVILFLFSEYMLMMVIFSVAFLAYALAVTPPTPVYYRISTEGVAVEDHFYLWQELYDFYFKSQHHYQTLHIRTKAYLPGEIAVIVTEEQKEDIKSILLAFLPYREVVRTTFTEKAGNWLVKTFPLERPAPHKKHS